MARDLNFSEQVNQLFFGVDVSDTSPALLDSFRSVSQLHHRDKIARQWNLNVATEMKSDKAWSSRHEFTFTKSPLPGLEIEDGTINITLGQTDSASKLLRLDWRLQFEDKAVAKQYFERLKQLFGDVATNQKIEHDANVGEIAQFSTRKPGNTGVRDVSLCLGKSALTERYEISLLLGSDFVNE